MTITGVIASEHSGSWNLNLSYEERPPHREVLELEDDRWYACIVLNDRTVLRAWIQRLANADNADTSELDIGTVASSRFAVIRDGEFPDRCLLRIVPDRSTSRDGTGVMIYTVQGEAYHDFVKGLRSICEQIGA